MLNEKQRQAADHLLAAIQEALASRLYGHAQWLAIRSPVGRKTEDFTCLVFSDTAETCAYLQARLCSPTPAEALGFPPKPTAPAVITPIPIP